MDLVEIRKKAQLKPLTRPSQTESDPLLSAQLQPQEELFISQLLTTPVVAQGEESVLQKCFPGLTLATEEDYIQGISGCDQGVGDETEQWLSFLLGQEEYALSLEVVLELIKPRTYTILPKVPDYVKGILSLRGVVVPVIDIRLRLKLGQGEADSCQRIIVCEGKEQSIGLLVDRITQVVRVAKSAIEPAPLALSELERRFVTGVGRYQERMFILLNPDEILKV
jgi:purine-binding chemotaxis protein CheW